MTLRLVSRAEWGARPYSQPSGGTLYSRARRGVKLHYLGSAYSDRPHTQCPYQVRQIQAQHMTGNGWSDIGYSFVVCTHGYVFEGRGLKRRNSANGNTTLNEQDYAVLLLVGSSGLTKPTTAQLDGARDAIDYCREKGPAGDWIGGHRDGYATACPGDAIYAWAKNGAPRPGEEEDPMAGITKQDIYNAVWLTDAATPPKGTASATNPRWAPASLLRDVTERVRGMEKSLAAQSAAITALAGQIGQDVDTAAVVAAVEQAIKDAVITVDVDVTGAGAP